MIKRMLLGLVLMPCLAYAMQQEHPMQYMFGLTKEELLIKKKDTENEVEYTRSLPPKLCCVTSLTVWLTKTSNEYMSSLESETPVRCGNCCWYKFGQKDEKRDEELFKEMAAEYEKQQK